MRHSNKTWVAAAGVVGLVIAQCISGTAAQGGAPATSTKQAGSASGTLTVGSSKLQLSHAYAFPEKDKSDSSKENYRIFVIDQPLTAAAVKFAASAGNDEEARQELVLELADRKIQGLEIIVAADKRVLRSNIYTVEFAMGMMLLEPTQFQATTLDPQRIAGKLFTEKPIQDIRIDKSVQYDATFSAVISRSPSN